VTSDRPQWPTAQRTGNARTKHRKTFCGVGSWFWCEASQRSSHTLDLLTDVNVAVPRPSMSTCANNLVFSSWLSPCTRVVSGSSQ
jgi:hypothetical protein